MKSAWVSALNIILAANFAFANTAAPIKTSLEQVSIEFGGQMHYAQRARVEIPAADDKSMVITLIRVKPPKGPERSANSVTMEGRTTLNGRKYVASYSEPLSGENREKAVGIAKNQVDWTRRGAPAETAERIQNHPTYAGSADGVLSIDYNPYSQGTRGQIGQLTESGMAASNNAFAGIAEQKNRSNWEAEQYRQSIQQATGIRMQLQNEASRSDFVFTQSMTDFSESMQSLQDREVVSLAQQIAQADPYTENIITSGDTEISSDIRNATNDVSPLNPNASENIKRYDDRFAPNGLVKNGLFRNEEAFPATPIGHRILESANMLSDVAARDPAISSSPAGTQLVGAGYVYMNAAMKALQEGRSDDAKKFSEQGRRIGRSLRGEHVPDDLENALWSSEKATAIHEQAYRDTLGIKGEGRELLQQGFEASSPNTDDGKLAKTLGQSLLKNSQGLNESELKSLGLNLLDMSIGMVPVVSSVQSLLYMAAGKNLITGEPLSALDYTLCAIDVLSLGTSGPLTKVAGKLPKALGTAFKGSEILITKGLKIGAEHVQNLNAFVKGSVKGLRDLEKVAPTYALKNFPTSPGAVLSLGQSISHNGGASFAKELMEYSAKNSMDIVETAHIARFKSGMTKVVSAEDYYKYGGGATLGKPGARTFVLTTQEYEKLAKSSSNAKELAEKIGVPDPTLKGGFMRYDIKFNFEWKPGLPTGKEIGANEYFKSGGKTIGGAYEATVDAIPMTDVIERGKVVF